MTQRAVIFPPGRSGGNKPIILLDRYHGEYDGHGRARLLSSYYPVLLGEDNFNFETDQFGCKVKHPFEFPCRITVHDDIVFPFDIAKLAQPFRKALTGPLDGRGRRDQNVLSRSPRWLLRLSVQQGATRHRSVKSLSLERTLKF